LKYYQQFFVGKIKETHFPKRGDVIVFTPPHDTRMDYIKRVVGIPGDKIKLVQGHLFLNDQEVELTPGQENFEDFEGYDDQGNKKIGRGQLFQVKLPRGDGTFKEYTVLRQDLQGTEPQNNTVEYVVPENSVFVMGDNWDRSGDSRFLESLGYVHKNYFLGPAFAIFFSVDHQNISWYKPWTWLAIPFKIRWDRLGYHKII
jgi:signal peptidase I